MPTRDAGARTDRRDLDEYLSAQSQVPVQPPCVGIEVIQGGDEDSDDERWDVNFWGFKFSDGDLHRGRFRGVWVIVDIDLLGVWVIVGIRNLPRRSARFRGCDGYLRLFRGLCGGRVPWTSSITWGDTACGGDMTSVQQQLQEGVESIQSTERAFAALKTDGSVVTWGDGEIGGDSTSVQDQLTDVLFIRRNVVAFAAILRNGSVVSWGFEEDSGDSSAVQQQDELRTVHSIAAAWASFAAIRLDGSVVTWGLQGHGGDSSHVQVTWGKEAEFGGDSQAVRNQLQDVCSVAANNAVESTGFILRWTCKTAAGTVIGDEVRKDVVKWLASNEKLRNLVASNGRFLDGDDTEDISEQQLLLNIDPWPPRSGTSKQ
ncbi:hypothetical protein AK812_SmicGene35764 [Symbiodinium microadriaticum]|uniref:E3 ubiquitin-protein ligase HERC2 n=1 Tax=Symbiodinium microadriaticum TaxID=2951 RepID=A0A1Q9CKL6_SYMMI|nr:hypothetical protein AK812_SmicGene35764 [Symbiodinium microadriaticum]